MSKPKKGDSDDQRDCLEETTREKIETLSDLAWLIGRARHHQVRRQEGLSLLEHAIDLGAEAGNLRSAAHMDGQGNGVRGVPAVLGVGSRVGVQQTRRILVVASDVEQVAKIHR